jgi:sugar phosphate isomerase/epimerase
MMKLGIFAKTFEGDDASSVLRQAAAAGYGAVQYNLACSGIGSLPLEVSDDVAADVAEASTSLGVEIAAVSATYNMTHPDPTKREQGRAAFTSIASQARAMGTNLVTLCTGSMDALDQWRYHPDNGSPFAWAEMMREFSRIIPIAEKYDVLLGIEPELANIISSAHKARSLIDTLRSDRLRIVLDAANLFEVETDERRDQIIAEAIHALDDRIVLAHAKDRNPDGSFTTAGRGVLDYPRYLQLLSSAGFSGVLVTHGLSQEEAPGVARFLGSLTGRAS